MIYNQIVTWTAIVILAMFLDILNCVFVYYIVCTYVYTKQIPRGYSKPPPTQCFTSSPSALFNFDNRVEKNIFKRLTLLGKKLSYNLHIIIWDSFIVFCCDICRNLSKGYVWWQNKYNHHQMTRLATTHSQMCNKQKILLQQRQMKNIFKIMTAFVVLVGEFRLNCRIETRGKWWTIN